MGPKKKPQQKQKPATQNKLRIFKTQDGAIFNINDSLASKYSQQLKKKIQSAKNQEPIQLNYVSKDVFIYIEQFFNLHKQKQPQIISTPLKSNIELKHNMEEGDAKLMEKISEKGDQMIKKVLDAASQLQIQDLRKRLFALISFNLIRFTVDQLKNKYDLPNIQINQELLKTQMKNRLQQIRKMQEDKKQSKMEDV